MRRVERPGNDIQVLTSLTLDATHMLSRIEAEKALNYKWRLDEFLTPVNTHHYHG